MASPCCVYQLGVNPPADIASGRIAEAFLNALTCFPVNISCLIL